MLVCIDIKCMQSLLVSKLKIEKKRKKKPHISSTWYVQACLGLRQTSDEGLTLETSAFQIFHGGISTFINSFDGTKFSCFILPPPDAAPQFL